MEVDYLDENNNVQETIPTTKTSSSYIQYSQYEKTCITNDEPSGHLSFEQHGDRGFSDLPVEIVEYILSMVPEPNLQTRFSRVCKLWRDLVLRLRWLKLLSFERRVNVRLPLERSLHEQQGSKGFSLLLTVSSPVLLAGVAIFLPFREDLVSNVGGEVELMEHGVAYTGPSGDTLSSLHFAVSRDDGRRWQEDCRDSICLQGPWQTTRIGGSPAEGCVGLHPLPIIFKNLVELCPGVRYMLSLKLCTDSPGRNGVDTAGPGVDTGGQGMDTGGPRVDTGGTWVDTGGTRVDTGGSRVDTGGQGVDTGGSWVDTGGTWVDAGGPGVDTGGTGLDTVGTVWGFKGVPRRKNKQEQNYFRWFQVYRQGLNSSVSSRQFPIIYYIA